MPKQKSPVEFIFIEDSCKEYNDFESLTAASGLDEAPQASFSLATNMIISTQVTDSVRSHQSSSNDEDRRKPVRLSKLSDAVIDQDNSKANEKDGREDQRSKTSKKKAEQKQKSKRKGHKRERRSLKRRLEKAAGENVRGCYVVEVSEPTAIERETFHRSVFPECPAKYTQFTPNPDHLWDLMVTEKANPNLSVSLTARISTKNPGKPLAVRYDQVETASEETEIYQYKSPFTQQLSPGSAGLTHSLFSNNNSSNDTGGSLLSPFSSDQPLASPEIQEWYPRDPDEFILNSIEIELAWLGEESIHCLRSGPHFQWDFIWHYASPLLRAEMRKLEYPGETSEHKLRRIVRLADPLVKRRFKVVRKHIQMHLVAGFRRIHMRNVIAQLRLKHKTKKNNNEKQQQEQQQHNNNLQWDFPPADLEAASKETYRYQEKSISIPFDEIQNDDSES